MGFQGVLERGALIGTQRKARGDICSSIHAASSSPLRSRESKCCQLVFCPETCTSGPSHWAWPVQRSSAQAYFLEPKLTCITCFQCHRKNIASARAVLLCPFPLDTSITRSLFRASPATYPPASLPSVAASQAAA